MGHFERAAELAPTSPHPRRATCQSLVAQKRKEEAVSECEKAIELQKSHENATALAQTLATPPYTPEQLDRALELSALAVRHGSLADLVTRCSVLITAEQVEASQTCTETLRLRAPNSKVAYTLSALSSASASELSEAYAYLERARSLGADAEQIDAVEELVEVRTPLSQRVQRWTRNLLVGWFGLGIIVAAIGLTLSSVSRRLARRLPLRVSDPPPPSIARARLLYRPILWLSCLLFYLTLPLILLSTLIFSGALVLLMLRVGWIPVYPFVAVVTVASLAISSTLSALKAEGTYREPGEGLDLELHPLLKAVLGEVATRMAARPIDTVFLTSGCDFAVFEQLRLGQILLGETTSRCLVLGVGVLREMKLLEFKSLLAHEYGHFKIQDTVGGALALAAQRSMNTLLVSLAINGAAAWYNPAWWFARGFFLLFRRISHGASQLQEVLADRSSAFAYGAAAFERGLIHVTRREVDFFPCVSAALNLATARGRTIQNIYQKAPPPNFDWAQCEQACAERLAREPSPYDSHPSPTERLLLVRVLETEAHSDEDNDADAWELFPDRRTIERRMTKVLLSQLATAAVIHPAKASF